MKLVLQRVSSAEVKVDNKIVGTIQRGFLVLVGFASSDEENDLDNVCKKIIALRVFPDENSKMNLSLAQVQGEVLLVSQFTLYADLKKGNRPSFIEAANPEKAKILYEKFVEKLKSELGERLKTGIFGAKMQISLVNEGPVTLILDTKDL